MISDLLQNKTAKERANIKATEIAKLNFAKYTDDRTGITVEIKDGKINAIEGGIELYARAWQGVNQLGFGKDGTTEWERFIFQNPRILIDDPSGTIIKEWTDEDGVLKQRKLKEDPLEATKLTLAHTIKVSSKEGTEIIKGSTGNTTSTFYPDPDVETTSVDGLVRRSLGEPGEGFGTIHNGAGTEAFPSGTVSGGASIRTSAGTNPNYIFFGRVVMLFDTSSIPDTDTISSATMSVASENKTATFGVASATVVLSNPASNTN